MSKLVDKYGFIILIALTVIFIFSFSEYYFYSSDQTTQITAVLHFFDNELYKKDFEMQMINPPLVKMIPHLLLFAISKVALIPVEIIYFLAFVITTFFVLYLTYLISCKLIAKMHIGLLACLLLLLGRGECLLSNFMVITRSVLPFFLAVPFNLLALYLVLKKRYLCSVFICGILFYLHGQISFFTFLAALSVIVFYKKDFKLLKKAILLYTLILLPALLSLLLAFAPFTQPIPEYSIKELSLFRVPLQVFPSNNIIFLYGGLMFFIAALLKFNKLRKEFCYWNYTLLAITAFGIIFTRFIPIEFVMLLYPFRVDVFLVISFAILASITLFNLIEVIRLAINKKSIERRDLTKLLIFFLAMFFALNLIYVSDFRPPRIEPPEDVFTDIANYARLHTPKYSLFLTPPHLQGFRLYSQRSNVVEAKANAIGRGSKIQDEWFNRLLTLCNVTEFDQPWWNLRRECRYESLTREEYLSLCKTYDADYFVTRNNSRTKQWSDLLVYNNSEFALFKCSKQ